MDPYSFLKPQPDVLTFANLPYPKRQWETSMTVKDGSDAFTSRLSVHLSVLRTN